MRSWKLPLLVTWSRAWVTREHTADIWSQDNTDDSTCGVSTNSADTVSKVSWQWFTHWVFGIRWCLWRNHVFLVRKKNRLTLPCDSTAHMTLRERWVVIVGHYSQKLLPVICYFQVPSKSVACQMGCDLTVSCPDESTHMLCAGASHLQFPHLNRENMLHEFFEQMASHEYKVYSLLMARFFHFPPQYVDLKSISLPTCFGQIKIFTYQAMIFLYY